MSNNQSPHQEKALALLASGCTAAQTAGALGITESAVSQMISDEDFAASLASQKFETLHKHNARDAELDSLEDNIIAMIKKGLGTVWDPMKLARLLQVVNAAKRRGQSSPDAVIQKQTVIPLTMPTQIIQHFTTNLNNQVVQVGSTPLVTIQSGQMENLLAKQNATLANASKRADSIRELGLEHN